ncbi:hypothetical protein AMTR_s00028p00093730 [Amborella trichopoda]|uniref:Uncharacterized protein n=1 Tax=Amborella trichopoda TaxID=13333 RepID=W1PKN1_AMBTC|nr:hypothetical protein AMTR_s00028p00093730 [Amborella trichopoda]
MAPDIEIAPEVPTSTISEVEPQSQPDASLSKTLELVVVPTPEVSISVVPDVEPSSKPDTPSRWFQNEDKAYLAKIKDVEEEKAKLQAYLNRLKIQQD